MTIFNRLKIPVHIEIVLDSQCTIESSEIESVIEQYLQEKCQLYTNGPIQFDENSFSGIVKSIEVCGLDYDQTISPWQAEIFLHSFILNEQESEKDFLDNDGNDDNNELPIAEQWELPNILLHGLWNSIIINHKIKLKLINYCCTSLKFSQSSIDFNIINWNKMILLYGPPGTGKTSICKSLAQKIYIRYNKIYSNGILFEINCHSLFSKWFSESGKLVMKLFSHINDLADDTNTLIFLLIDEVESIASARSASSSSGEPGDAIRVVNAVLTSLDNLRRRSNVLVLCTSNMIDSLDPAFLDRLDLKIFLGNPNIEARYQIIYSFMKELVSKGVIQEDSTFNLSSTYVCPDGKEDDDLLYQAAIVSEGMSGRSLRKLPVRTHARFMQKSTIFSKDFLEALIEEIKEDKEFNE